MSYNQDTLDQFMAAFEQNTTAARPETAAAQFATHFVAGGPQGSAVVPVEFFVQKLPERKELFRQAGLQSRKLVGRRDTQVGDRYALVQTQWQMDFAREDRTAVTFVVGSSFLIDMGGSEPKILAYLSDQDVFQLMRERGLMPAG
jgi:hypothetical protein